MLRFALILPLALLALYCGKEPDKTTRIPGAPQATVPPRASKEVPVPAPEPVVTRKLNRLAKEKSPYLRQHADNPVDWYPWGKEAFEKARRENLPIFLSIGYSSCHWCHVMEHESFSDPVLAAFLNKHFVSIKVDREERPDIDEVYMLAAQLIMRGGGGWPLSIWLTPEGKPFFAGTYFPREAKYGQPGFLDLLKRIAEVWSDPEKRKRIEADSVRVASYVKQVYDSEKPAAIGLKEVDQGAGMAMAQVDPEYGGFGNAPKFPSPTTLETLLRTGLRKNDQAMLEAVFSTLDHMEKGGIHDHVGGGFHRYSTTRDWRVPHFEKMLYDNAQLLGLYAWASLLHGKAHYARTAADIARWVQREMTSPQGGFFSAQDADDPGGPEGEGGHYIWDQAQIGALFDPDEARVVEAWFGITKEGNWPERPGKTILERLRNAGEVAEKAGVEPEAASAIVQKALPRMYTEREKRPKPMTDTKIIAGWNGLMISGFCKAYQVFSNESYLDSALRAGRFVRTHLMREGRLLRRWAGGEAAHEAVLADYAYVIAAFLDLYESTFDEAWLREALRLEKLATKFFYDPKEGGYFFTARDGEKLIARGKPGTDNARPSPNGVMALDLLRIAELTGDDTRRDRAEKTLAFFGARITQSAMSASTILNAVAFARSKPREIFIAGPRDDPRTRALIQAVWKDPDPNRVLALVTPGIEKLLPPAAAKTEVQGAPAAYVCRNFTCQAPVTDPAALALALK